MIYTENTIKAMQIAYDAHRSQFDKSGVPYVFHPFHLAEQMDSEEEVIAALLHDVIEDSGLTGEFLLEQGFPGKIVDAVLTLTRPCEKPYDEYVRSIRENPIARKVKIADLKHNMDESRLCCAKHAIDPERIAKYRKALDYLENN